MDGWDPRWELAGDALDAGLEVPHDPQAEYFVGQFDGHWFESVLSFYHEWRINWGDWRGWPVKRSGVVERRLRYLLYWRRRGNAEWQEVDGVSAMNIGGQVRYATWVQDLNSEFSIRRCWQLYSEWRQVDGVSRIYWDD